jgi:hypothetical protein
MASGTSDSMHAPVIPEADALAEAIRDLRQVPDSLAPTLQAGLGFRDDG